MTECDVSSVGYASMFTNNVSFTHQSVHNKYAPETIYKVSSRRRYDVRLYDVITTSLRVTLYDVIAMSQ